MRFSMISPCPSAHIQHRRMPLHRAVLSKREVCSGLVCGRRHGHDAALRLARSTELKLRSSTFWRRIRFSSKLIEKWNMEHETWVSERSLHSATLLIDFEANRSKWIRNLSTRHQSNFTHVVVLRGLKWTACSPRHQDAGPICRGLGGGPAQ